MPWKISNSKWLYCVLDSTKQVISQSSTVLSLQSGSPLFFDFVASSTLKLLHPLFILGGIGVNHAVEADRLKTHLTQLEVEMEMSQINISKLQEERDILAKTLEEQNAAAQRSLENKLFEAKLQSDVQIGQYFLIVIMFQHL